MNASLHASSDNDFPASIVTVAVYIGWSLFVLIALTVLGVDMTSLAVIAGGLSVAFAADACTASAGNEARAVLPQAKKPALSAVARGLL